MGSFTGSICYKCELNSRKCYHIRISIKKWKIKHFPILHGKMFYIESNFLMNNNFIERKEQSPHTQKVYKRDNHPIGFYNIKNKNHVRNYFSVLLLSFQS
jgi:hypothetical protein